MAKRFTDTRKWENRWYRKLTVDEKMFWQYINDRCNHAGIWDVDFELASVCIGADLDEKALRRRFAARFFEIDNGKWVLRDFITLQYGGNLKPDVKAHISVLKILKEEKLSFPYPTDVNTSGKG